MAQILYPPKSIKKPVFNIDTYHEDEEKYVKELKAFCLANGSGKNVGETIKFQVADSYAVYMILSMNPLELIHVPVGDEWHFDHVDLMTTERVQEMIDHDKAMKSLFK
jgi:hypothetical protein